MYAHIVAHISLHYLLDIFLFAVELLSTHCFDDQTSVQLYVWYTGNSQGLMVKTMELSGPTFHSSRSFGGVTKVISLKMLLHY